MNMNQTLRVSFSSLFATVMECIILFSTLLCIVFTSSAYAQTAAERLQELRWKSESQVRSLLGEPNSVHGPIGTHASYVLWKYENMTVALANGRVFHIFDPDSLRKVALNER